MRFVIAVIALALSFARSTAANAQTLEEHLRKHGQPPAEYLLAKLADHRIVIAGENHYQRADVELIRSIVPELKRRNVALATELLRQGAQADIDKLLAAETWDGALANAVMRASEWPYVQYREILHEAWKANRTGGTPMRILALGPPADFREKKIDYDRSMAELVAAKAVDDDHRVLVHCGMHHAFTRFLQIERLRNGRPGEYMDRMGNILLRRFGSDVFLVALHKPDPCGGWERSRSRLCAPLDGAIDLAAVRAGGNPVAFDLLGSPIAETKLPESSFYAIGHPLIRMIDYADGYVWLSPVDRIAMVDVIAPDEYLQGGSDDEAERRSLERQAEAFAQPPNDASRRGLGDWRSALGKTSPAKQ